jgi:c(7)-type cytochrome triheme protein
MHRFGFIFGLISCWFLIGCGGGAATETKSATPKVVAKPVASPVAAPGMPPETITFASEYGTVVYTHQKHIDRVNGDCATCHPAVFPQALEPLDYGKARHRVAEEYKTSCATCHGISGSTFAAERNCQRCHEMGKH